MGAYVSLDDIFLLAMLDDVFWPCLMYIHILPNCCFIVQLFKMLSNDAATVHVQIKKIEKRMKLNK